MKRTLKAALIFYNIFGCICIPISWIFFLEFHNDHSEFNFEGKDRG